MIEPRNALDVALPSHTEADLEMLQHKSFSYFLHETNPDNGLMIENYRTGLLWRLMRDCPYIAGGLRRAGFGGGWL